MMRKFQCLALAYLSTVAGASFAEAPVIKAPMPLIYLADNLDEEDHLGWCIDTVGRGFSDQVHAHSCKPQGGDVQFDFNETTGLIKSVAFKDYCIAISASSQTTFSLEKCDSTDVAQRFIYTSASREFSPENQPQQCISVGSNSRSAGPFMSRELLLAECSKTKIEFKEWVIAK